MGSENDAPRGGCEVAGREAFHGIDHAVMLVCRRHDAKLLRASPISLIAFISDDAMILAL